MQSTHAGRIGARIPRAEYIAGGPTGRFLRRGRPGARVGYAACAAAAAVAAAVVLSSLPGEQGRTMLENSAPHVGAGRAAELGYTGSGIRVAVIDTGVDASHPDLAGRVSGGYDFVDGGEPDDANGHGTQVAGIIAAGGAVSGMAPGAVIVPYKVSEDGESVSSDLIERAIRTAAADGADVINISLGVPIDNPPIDAAVADAVEGGAVVVVAAGNDGPDPSTIGSPGGAPLAITVGATHNNVRASMVSTLSVGGKQYEVAPMLGVSPAGPITAPLADGGYGRPGDIGPDARGAILLMERGSGEEGELIYFTQKESNAADAGALAAIVYNNEPGAYLGDVSAGPGGGSYEPRIPILSMEREDGLELAGSGGTATVEVFYNPDHVAFFSSRGPSSPFYIKPDLVAPGAFVNSTHAGGRYDLASGTSFAAPHVSGAAALLLEKHPGLSPAQARAVLSSTASPSADSYGAEFGPTEVGSGRLDAAAALDAQLVLEPAQLVMAAPPSGQASGAVRVERIDGGPPPPRLDVSVSEPEGWSASHAYSDGVLTVRAEGGGQGWGRISIDHGGVRYTVPVLARESGGSVTAAGGPGKISVGVQEPGGWQYARATAYDSRSGAPSSAPVLPGVPGEIPVGGPGKYWIEARIATPDGTQYAYSEAVVDEGPYGQQIPQSAWLAAAAAAVAAGAGIRRAARRRL